MGRRLFAGLLLFAVLAGIGQALLLRASPRPVIAVDPGHGGIDGGATYGRILEKDLNLKMAFLVEEALKAEGLSPFLTRRQDVHLSLRSYREDLARRLELAQKSGARLLIALHANVAEVPDAEGSLVLFRPRDERSRLLARIVREELEAADPERPNVAGVERDHFYLDHSPLPTVIVEIGYLTNPRDRQKLSHDGYLRRLAQALARAARRYLEAPPPAN